jgi:ABC-type branched-subunit amino acid transport system ATPase component
VPFWLNAIFGLFAIVIAMQGGQQPVPARLRAALDRLGGRRALEIGSAQPPPALRDPLQAPAAAPAAGGAGLEVEALTVRFGGLVAVSGITFSAPLGRITGLIGPNGAGKTTAFNACCGLNRPSAGSIRFRSENIGNMSAAGRGRRGLGRTFQTMQLCDTLSVASNVALGREAGLAGNRVFSQFVAGRRDDHAVQEAAAEAMALCGISHLAEVQAGQLSTGHRRLTELARCIAGNFDLLLLDEPSSGLDKDETAQFADVITRLASERGTGILLVEHDVSLVMEVCEYIYVLDFGELIFEGDPAAVAASPVVQAAYLGTSDVIPADTAKVTA